jgi:glycosyltransferase involved in cell wall biosynthesis
MLALNMHKIKIAFIIDTIHEKLGGTERQLILLLQNLDRSKIDPYLCCFKDSTWLQDHAKDWKTHLFHFNSFYSPLDFWRLYQFSRFLKKEGIEIVQTHFRDGNIVGVLAAKMAGIKRVISTRRNQGYWHNKTEILVLKIINRWVNRFLANSESVKKYVAVVEKIAENKIDVIYNGFDMDRFRSFSQEEKLKICQKLKISCNEPIITMSANLRPVKGHDVFFKAVKILLSGRKLTFLIIGDGPEKDNLKILAADLGISDHVHFLGSRPDIQDFLGISTIGVLTSHSEGLSNAIIEYMAAGLPVVATEVGGNPELIENNVNGYLVPDNDHEQLAAAIQRLLNNKNLRKKMGQVSSIKAKHKFDLNHILGLMESYYLEVADQPDPGKAFNL